MEVILKYHREQPPRSDTLTGSILVREGKEEKEYHEFRWCSFKAMMTYFAQVLIEHRGATAIVERTDREGLLPVPLSDMLTQRLREDPVEAIRQLSPPPVVVDVREKVPPPSSLRVGHDAVADAFGDEVYCRARGEQIECPVCGSWNEVIEGSLHCSSCRVCLHATPAGPDWWTVPTIELLCTKTFQGRRYFIPRAWNKTPPWISFHDLNEKYNQYLKEKYNV